jgi:hypothetical protein
MAAQIAGDALARHAADFRAGWRTSAGR